MSRLSKLDGFLCLKVQKLSDTSAKLSDDVLAQISLKKSQRYSIIKNCPPIKDLKLWHVITASVWVQLINHRSFHKTIAIQWASLPAE